MCNICEFKNLLSGKEKVDNNFIIVVMYKCKWCEKIFRSKRHKCMYNPENKNCFSCRYCTGFDDFSCSEISRKIKRDKGTVLKFIRENGLHYQPLTICIKRRVVQLDSNFNYIETFESIREASRKTNLVSIGGCLQKRMKTCGGYKWMYEEDYKKMLEEQKAGD